MFFRHARHFVAVVFEISEPNADVAIGLLLVLAGLSLIVPVIVRRANKIWNLNFMLTNWGILNR